ncbi:hypothetical protein HZA99_04350 [Candidatus Woesearchaeota archaeon]|nr:hypothetical protein [Candidatus Woesearchaeota archaeon]
MKQNILFVSVLLLLLFVAACGSGKVYVCADGSEVASAGDCVTPAPSQTPASTTQTTASQTTTEKSTSQTTDTVASEKSVNYSLSDAERALLEERFAPAKRAELSTPLVKNLHPGDVSVAALGLRNILGGATETFIVTIKFREAKDFSGSIIPTDDALVQNWLGKNVYIPYTLERGEEVVLPIIIDVGNTLTAKGDPVAPGTYIYDVSIAYVTNPEMTDPYQNLILTVQVAE